MTTRNPPLYEDLALLLIDVQMGFLDLGHGVGARLIARYERLLKIADWLDLPVISTLEEPVADKGGLPASLDRVLPLSTKRLTKTTFDCMQNEAVKRALEETRRRVVAVAGGETDVCVVLSIVSLLEEGYCVYLLEDCLFTSTADPSAAIARMRAAGAIPCTLKTLAFELTATVDRATWPSAWREKLDRRPDLFPPPEDLAPEL